MISQRKEKEKQGRDFPMQNVCGLQLWPMNQHLRLCMNILRNKKEFVWIWLPSRLEYVQQY